MGPGFGIRRRIRRYIACISLIRFSLKRVFMGFDVANQYLQRVGKPAVKLILRKNGATIGENCDLETGLVFHNCDNYKRLVIGNNCHIGKGCFFDLRQKIIIEDNVVVSMQVTFITHLDVGNSPLKSEFKSVAQPIRIKPGVYIGARVTILMGITLGESSLIAAGSLVKDDVAGRTLVGGVPAKKIKEIQVDQ
jgi:acetyltransferase-like isoleucine patch superfamily enzyme